MRRWIGVAVVALGLTVAGPSLAAVLKGDCPDGYVVKAGLNPDFPHKGAKRAFVVYPPLDAKGGRATGPAPVFVPLTGSVESTMDNLTVPRSGATSLMAAQGFLVIGPVRECANQDPNLKAGVCNGPGHDGWNWNPWHEGRAAGPAGDAFKTDEGSDSSFLIAAVTCAAKSFPVDARRIYLGGISSGGTMTNRALTFRSDFWAGGLPISGEWYVTQDDGTPLSFEGGRAALAAEPAKVHQGRVGPYPLKAKLDPLVVITVWGGEKDLWKCDGVLCADYRPSTQAASNYFASMKTVVHVACSAGHGHMWPQANTQAFNAWALKTLASHPKGSDPKAFKLTPPPEGYACKLGRFTDHYPEG
jgi:poly(3-hydroxybutyrate) depolymerase